jgi:hypothetical protein
LQTEQFRRRSLRQAMNQRLLYSGRHHVGDSCIFEVAVSEQRWIGVG